MADKKAQLKVKKEEGYLYYIGRDGYLWKIPMKNNPNGRKKKIFPNRKIDRYNETFVFRDGWIFIEHRPFNELTSI